MLSTWVEQAFGRAGLSATDATHAAEPLVLSDSMGVYTHGTKLLYEPLNRYETNLFNNIADTAAWLRTLKTHRIRILADLFHMNIEEPALPSALRAAGSLVGHIHFADSNRRAIGLGHTNAAPIVAALREIGYDGYLSAEILPLPDADTAAQRTIESFRKFTT
jgi:sugar phosphate isomerase/epimerase